MDVARELKAVEYKVQLQIRGQALRAEARIYGMDPYEYTEAVLLAQRLTAAEEARVQAQQTASAMEDVGRAYGQMYRALQDAAASFARGFQAAMGQ